MLVLLVYVSMYFFLTLAYFNFVAILLFSLVFSFSCVALLSLIENLIFTSFLAISSNINWGKLEQAPHRQESRKNVCLSVYICHA